MALASTALPYGMRDIKLIPFTDESATTEGTPVDLPNARTLSFSEAEEFTELRGDDKLVAIHGQGATVEWELESGGISLEAWKVLTGGSLTTSGTTPASIKILTKTESDVRPYFKLTGKAISDSGGHILVTIWRAKVNDSLEGEFTDGEFFLTSASGVGLGSLEEDDMGTIYTIEHVETADPTT